MSQHLEKLAEKCIAKNEKLPFLQLVGAKSQRHIKPSTLHKIRLQGDLSIFGSAILNGAFNVVKQMVEFDRNILESRTRYGLLSCIQLAAVANQKLILQYLIVLQAERKRMSFDSIVLDECVNVTPYLSFLIYPNLIGTLLDVFDLHIFLSILNLRNPKVFRLLLEKWQMKCIDAFVEQVSLKSWQHLHIGVYAVAARCGEERIFCNNQEGWLWFSHTSQHPMSPVLIAIEFGHTEIVRKMLNEDNCKKHKSAEGFSLIEFACLHRKADIVQLLLPLNIPMEIVDVATMCLPPSILRMFDVFHKDRITIFAERFVTNEYIAGIDWMFSHLDDALVQTMFHHAVSDNKIIVFEYLLRKVESSQNNDQKMNVDFFNILPQWRYDFGFPEGYWSRTSSGTNVKVTNALECSIVRRHAVICDVLLNRVYNDEVLKNYYLNMDSMLVAGHLEMVRMLMLHGAQPELSSKMLHRRVFLNIWQQVLQQNYLYVIGLPKSLTCTITDFLNYWDDFIAFYSMWGYH